MDYKDLGSRIRTKRKEQRMSQAELAGKAQLSTQHISNVENARSKIGLEKLVDIANVLDCSLDELACGSVNSAGSVYNNEIAEMIEDLSDIQRRALPQFLDDFNSLYKFIEREYKKQNE